MALRITSWNVNGIRNPFSYQPWSQTRTFQDMFDILEADIVIMQETKIQRKDLRDDMVLVPGWDVHFSLPKHKKGYAGVAIYTRTSKCCPIRAEEGITGVLCPPNSAVRYRDLPLSQQIGGYPQPDQLSGLVDEVTLDSEGRCVILEFPAFVLLGVYSPANRDDSRDDFRIGFFEALDARVRNLVAEGKQVVLTGDMNVTSTEKDTCNLAERLRKEGLAVEDFFSSPSRRLFNHLIFEGQVFGERDVGKDPILSDLCRKFHPEREGMFTCWDTKKNTRPANNGSRIDYVLCSSDIRDWVTNANIQEGLMGSDHCPVFAVLSDTVACGGEQAHVLDMMNPEGMFRGGKRQREWSNKDLLPLSARLIPEFDRRRSIKDMFMKKSTQPAANSDAETSANSAPERTTDEPSATTLPSAPTSSLGNSQEKANQTSSAPGSLAKRPAPCPTSLTPSPKKPKTSTAQAPAKAVPGQGQSTLKTFFRPKAPVSAPTLTTSASAPSDGGSASKSDRKRVKDEPLRGLSRTTSSTQSHASEDEAQQERSDKVFDPVQAKESWSKLLGGRILPKCEHGEACIRLVTKKPGVNYGRSFFICPRPLGPSGEKERGTEWRCGTFIWSSDWGVSRASPSEG